MDCAYPLELAGMDRPVPCGRCMNCRVNIMRMWTGRILLEQRYAESVFVTFTYEEEEIPRLSDGRTNLDPAELTNLIKRIRKSVRGGFRYFGVGEYGGITERAHFHLLAFAPRGAYWPYEDAFWQKAWSVHGAPKGYTSLSPADATRIRYCMGYTTKKLTAKSDRRLEGRYPEFSRQSRKPPIGAQGIAEILDTMCSRAGSHQIVRERDVPSMYRYDGKIYPIGRYWRNWLRTQYGYPTKKAEDWTQPDDWNITIKKARVQEHMASKRLREKAAQRSRYKVGS